MIKLICTDIDGTLVPDGTYDMNTEIFEVIRELKKKGVIFAAASGRQYKSMKELFQPVQDDVIFIAEGGNLVMCRETELAVTRMEKEDILTIIREIEAIPECAALLAGPLTSYARKDAAELLDIIINSYHYEMQIVDDLREIADKEIIKISLFQREGKADEVLQKILLPKWKENDKFELLCAGDFWIDFVYAGSNKGTAIEKIQNTMNISPAETMAFGDNINDIHMLNRAEYSFAIGNARDEVKKTAKYIADTNINDGVLKEMKKLLQKLNGGFEDNERM